MPKESPARRLSWKQVLLWRVERQQLGERAKAGSMLSVVSRTCGLHAQLMSSAELSAWARVEELEREDVRRALWEERSLVKTWAMRGTLHLLPSEEFPLWQAALSTYDHYLKGAWLRAFGMSRTELETLIETIGRILNGEMLTREELARRVGQEFGSDDLPERMTGSWGSMLKPAAFRGALCFAPNEGRNVRFTHPAWWLGAGPVVDGGQASQEVTRRYLGAYGPATREDYARWWAGLSPAGALKAFKALGDEVVLVDVGGTHRWMLAEHLEDVTEASPQKSVRLLPAFDPYVIGASRGQASILAPEAKARVYRAQGWISPVVIVDGKIVGIWKHEKKGRRTEVTVEPFEKLPARARREVERETERLANFLGGEPGLEFVS